MPERLQARLGEARFLEAPLQKAADRHRAHGRPAPVQRQVVPREIAAPQRIDVGSPHLGIERLPPEQTRAGEEVAARLREARLHRNPDPGLRPETVRDHSVRREPIDLRRPHRAPYRELPAQAQQQMPFQHPPFDEEGVQVARGAVFIEGRSDGEPAPAARQDAHVLQPVAAVGARAQREALVDGVILVSAVTHVGAGVEQRSGASVGARGPRCQQGEGQRLTG